RPRPRRGRLPRPRREGVREALVRQGLRRHPERGGALDERLSTTPSPMLRLDRRHVAPFVSDQSRADLAPRVRAAHRALLDPTGALLGDIEATAAEIRERADVFLCVGIGGSYLGAEAVIRALTPALLRGDGPEVLFAGHHLSPRYHAELLRYLDGKSVYV